MQYPIPLIDKTTEILRKEHSRNSTHAVQFNLFNILGITSDEVRLHSRLLAELLDPKGSHGQRSQLLELFLEQCSCTHVFTNSENVRVKVEYHIGSITETTGGRIDLLLTDDQQNALIIENKIYAGDQENQLLRYDNYGKQLAGEKSNYHILYLTLYGYEPSEFSTGKMLAEKNLDCISYVHHIRQWLTTCINRFPDLPKLTVALEHYQQLIEQLTGQNMNNTHEQEIIAQINQTRESFESAQTIANTLWYAKQQLLLQFGNRLTENILETFSGSCVELSERFGSKYEGIELFAGEPGNPENRNSHIRFSFLSDFDWCYLEIHPGLRNGVPIPKNAENQKQYETLLRGTFTRENLKIENTVANWGGEWVCRYHTFSNRFTDLIDHPEKVVSEVSKDLKIVYDAFILVEKQHLTQ